MDSEEDRLHVRPWLPLRELHKTIRRRLPNQSSEALVRVLDGMQTSREVSYRLRCRPGENPRTSYLASLFEDETVYPYGLTTADWDMVDPDIGLFRTFVIEVRWVEVLNLLEREYPEAAAALPTKKPTAKEPTAEQQRAENECRAWLEAHMKPSHDTPLGRRRDWYTEARKCWPVHLTRDGFDRAWRAAIQATKAHAWSSRGHQKNRLRMPSLH